MLDGRNRLRAIERVFSDPSERATAFNAALRSTINIVGAPIAKVTQLYSDTDPYGYVVSVNLRRRHLTGEQKRGVIAALLKAQPEKSNRQIAAMADSNRTTVGEVRSELEATGDLSITDTRTDSKGRRQPANKAPSLFSRLKAADCQFLTRGAGSGRPMRLRRARRNYGR